MARGGARPGAGRKKGAKSTKTQEIALAAAEGGSTPIEVILWFMRTTFESAQKAHADGDSDRALQMGALSMSAADKAAPYVHPKLTAIDHRSSDGSMTPARTLDDFYTDAEPGPPTILGDAGNS